MVNKNSKTLLWVIIVLLLLGGATVLVLWLTGIIWKRKTHKLCVNAPAGPVGSPCHWSSKQKSDMLKTIVANEANDKLKMGKDLGTCFVDNVAAKFSYAVASNPNWKPTKEQMLPLFKACFGTEKHWSDGFKTVVKNYIDTSPRKFSQACETCILSALENAFSPWSVLDLINKKQPPNTPDYINVVIEANCKSQCGSVH